MVNYFGRLAGIRPVENMIPAIGILEFKQTCQLIQFGWSKINHGKEYGASRKRIGGTASLLLGASCWAERQSIPASASFRSINSAKLALE